jgi:signal transduction histidine kinase
MGRSKTGGRAAGRAVAAGVAVGVLVTLASLLPLESVAYRSATFHVAIETGATLVALLSSALLFGRFLREPSRYELVLAASLLLLGLTNLGFSVIPWIADEEPGSFDTWAPVAGRLIGAAGLAVGAWVSAGRIQHARHAAVQAAGVVLGTFALIGVLAALLAPYLPVGIDPGLPPSPSGPDLVGEPALLACQAIGLVLYAIAALGFVRRAEQTGDELMSWLAAAATVAAFARLNYVLFPSITSEWVYTGDFLRLLSYVLVLAGALREIAAYQRDLAEVAVHRERRRIARQLHDGLAHELAFIAGQASRLGGGGDDAGPIAQAAARALDESRQAIATLARPVNAPLDASVSQAAQEVSLRNGVRLELDLAPGLEATDAVHEALTRIVREAVANAIHHGEAQSVSVALSGSDGVRLTVEDNGRGITEGEPKGVGFGLVSMRERAEALGGTVRLSSAPHGGARLEVWLP